MPEFDAAMARELGLGGVLPAVVALLLALAAARIWRIGLKRMYLPANLAFAGGFFLGFALLKLSPWWPKDHDYEWLAHVALVAGGAAAGARLTNVPYLRWSPVVVVPFLLAWLVVPTWRSIEPVVWYWRIGFVIATVGTWLSLQLPAEQIGGPRLTFALTAINAAVSMLLFLTGSAKFAQLSLLSAAVAGGLFIAELLDRNGPLSTGFVPAFAVLHAGWLGCAMLRSEAGSPRLHFFLMWLAPSMLGVAWLPWFRRRRWLGMLGPIAAAALLTLVSLVLAWRAHPAEEW